MREQRRVSKQKKKRNEKKKEKKAHSNRIPSREPRRRQRLPVRYHEKVDHVWHGAQLGPRRQAPAQHRRRLDRDAEVGAVADRGPRLQPEDGRDEHRVVAVGRHRETRVARSGDRDPPVRAVVSRCRLVLLLNVKERGGG